MLHIRKINSEWSFSDYRNSGILFIYFYLCICVSVNICHVSADACRDQKTWVPLQLELQVDVSYMVLRTELRSSGKGASPVNH